MVRQKQKRLCVEPLEDRRLLSANVVLEWNQIALQAIGQARVSRVVASRALAITQAARARPRSPSRTASPWSAEWWDYNPLMRG